MKFIYYHITNINANILFLKTFFKILESIIKNYSYNYKYWNVKKIIKKDYLLKRDIKPYLIINFIFLHKHVLNKLHYVNIQIMLSA